MQEKIVGTIVEENKETVIGVVVEASAVEKVKIGHMEVAMEMRVVTASILVSPDVMN